MKEQINPKEKKFAVRFSFYRCANREGDTKRFDEAPIQPFQYLDQDIESGISFVTDESMLTPLDMFDCKLWVNEFCKAKLPATLLSAHRVERMKLALMTSNITIDVDGQLAISWHDGELFIEIVQMYEVERHCYKFEKVLARYELLALPCAVDMFPPWEMDKNHQYTKELEQQAEAEREVIPVLLSSELIEAVCETISDGVNENQRLHSYEVFAYAMKREDMLVVQLISRPGLRFTGSYLVRFKYDGTILDPKAMTFGKPVKMAEVQDYFQANATAPDYHKFVEWFKRNNE